MDRLVGIGEAAQALGVSITTLRRREAAGRLLAEHTAGGHRRYDLAKLRPEMFRAEDEVNRCPIGRRVITYQDRLLRFGEELVFAICEAKNVEVVILNQGEDTTFEEDLAKDALEIITVFSARLYGSRSRKNQKLLDGVRAAVENAAC